MVCVTEAGREQGVASSTHAQGQVDESAPPRDRGHAATRVEGWPIAARTSGGAEQAVTRRPVTARRQPRRTARFVVLTGLSGSGKSQAINALEDLGYFCVDNLPTTLIPTLADLIVRAGDADAKAAVVIDVREGRFLSQFPKIFRKLRADRDLHAVLIFLESSETTLVRRFSETRRPHPLARDRSTTEGIREERGRLDEIRTLADEIIDSSDMTVHELRETFMRLVRGSAQANLVVTLLSFGFKYGIPVDADLVLDVRFLPNPYFVAALRRQTGRSRSVQRYLDKHEAMHTFLTKTSDLLRFLVPQYVTEGKSYLTIAIGCTGGRHRSVAVAEALCRRLRRMKSARLRVKHRDIMNG